MKPCVRGHNKFIAESFRLLERVAGGWWWWLLRGRVSPSGGAGLEGRERGKG